jgi:hypothetical protein
MNLCTILLLAYTHVLQVATGPYVILQITFVPFRPNPTKCVGYRPLIYVNTISRQEVIQNFPDKIISYTF